MIRITIKTQLIIFLLIFWVFLAIVDGDPLFIATTAVAALTALAAEAACHYIKARKIIFSESAAITGLIIGFVLYDQRPWWFFVAASALAIILKYIVRIKGRHIFNPAALGIFLTIIMFGAATQWKGTYYWQILVPVGLYFAHKTRKLEIIASYFVVTFLLFGTLAIVHHRPITGVFGYLSYFYIFIMVIEPKTSPVNRVGKIIFAALVAVLIFILTGAGARFDVELAALLTANGAAFLLNRINTKEER